MRIGLALGSGGASGLAHIAVLEAFDELGLTPHRITGSSIGAVLGALYASGMNAREIRKLVDDLVVQDTDTWREVLLDRQLLRWIQFVDPDIGEGGLISGDAFISYLHEAIGVTNFEELAIPMKVVTADLWTREQVVIETGDLMSAVKASMAVPGLFAPVILEGQTLVDGGIVNPVPYDLLFEASDVVVAINVIGRNQPLDDLSLFRSMFLSMRVMQTAILREKLKVREPDIYIETGVEGVRLLEFNKIDEILRQADPAKDRLKEALREVIAGPARGP
ncbi:MAG TPA: patatin-like phospholipase family protein [Kiritimatiellia bacterium]|nr:patatin-like phospholipase family protein [Kiritimatiellia bacterium]